MGKSSRRTYAIAVAVVAATAWVVVNQQIAAQVTSATVPGIPDAATARTELDALVIAAESPAAGYKRTLFPHWSPVEGACDTREMVLRRDGQDVRVDGQCEPVSGSWVSAYDGATWTSPSDVDIDHMVPLKEAWQSGAARWTTAQRREFANDLDSPQLWAVTDNVNQSKSDRDPGEWRAVDGECEYARAYTSVKHEYSLSVDQRERDALAQMLGTCP